MGNEKSKKIMINEMLGIGNMADIDISNFRETLSIMITKTQRVLPNCQKAFDMIENAVGLLERNFDGYYKDFVKTANPSIILLNFIGDVLNEQKHTSIELTA